nr:NHL repeat-containing protein [Candidatus Sigynarchaeota archaeon]
MIERLMMRHDGNARGSRSLCQSRQNKNRCSMLLFLMVTISCFVCTMLSPLPFSENVVSGKVLDQPYQPAIPQPSAFSYDHVGNFGMGHVPDPGNTAINGSGCFYTTSLNTHAVYVHSAEGKFLFRWGEYGTGPCQFSSPWGITVTTTGLVYVSDINNNRVQIFTQAGGYIDSIYGFNKPHGLASDTDGNIYVADIINSRIAMFNSNRQLIRYMPVPYPYGVATNATGFVYATSSQTDSVYVFNSTGQLVHQWSQEMYWGATGLSINGTGHVSVGAFNHASVRAFTQNGTYLFSFQVGHFNVRCVTVALDGNVWVTDELGIRNYTCNGTLISSIGTVEDVGVIYSPDGIAINGTGHIFLVDYYNRIQAFQPNGTFLCRWDDFNGQMFNELHDIAISPGGNIYVITGNEWEPNVVVAFDASRNYLLNWTVAYSARGIAINGSGAVYITDGEENVHVYNATGSPITQWSTGINSSPNKLAINETGHVYVSCIQDNRVRVYDPSGQLVTSWGGAGNTTGMFNSPGGICINSSGHVFVADTGNNRIQSFMPDGVFLHAWGSFGCGEDEIIKPRDVAIGLGGRFFVTDTYLDTGNYHNNRVQMFGNSPPSVKNAIVTPSTPNGAEDLQLHYSYEDA